MCSFTDARNNIKPKDRSGSSQVRRSPDGSYYSHNGYSGEELVRTILTSKAMLADMIVDTVSDKLEITECQDPEELTNLLASLGLHDEYLLVDADTSGFTKTIVQKISKA